MTSDSYVRRNHFWIWWHSQSLHSKVRTTLILFIPSSAHKHNLGLLMSFLASISFYRWHGDTKWQWKLKQRLLWGQSKHLTSPRTIWLGLLGEYKLSFKEQPSGSPFYLFRIMLLAFYLLFESFVLKKVFIKKAAFQSRRFTNKRASRQPLIMSSNLTNRHERLAH